VAKVVLAFSAVHPQKATMVLCTYTRRIIRGQRLDACIHIAFMRIPD